MKKLITLALSFSLISPSLVTYAEDNTPAVSPMVSGYISCTDGDIELVSPNKTPKIYVDEINDYPGVVRAANDLKDDITAVTGVVPELTSDANSADIIIGTIDKSDKITELADIGSIDISKISGEWEAFTLNEADGKLIIAGADKRGTIYGIYDLSESMGVSPWTWWADVVPSHSDYLYVSLPEEGYTEGASSVKYRGIFINQEWNLFNWSKSLSSDGSGMSSETYEKIFELLLRLKANYLWPAMHEYTPAFNLNPENARLADEYGIVMGSSHCEMLLRNNMGELLDFQNHWISEHPDKNLYMFKDGSLNADVAYDYTDTDADGNPVDNKEFIEDYWRERVRENKDYESNFTIGMRGVHDGAWNPVNAKTDDEKISLLEEIIAKQREILSEEIGKPANEIPQTFIPYKEILPLYNKGLNVPDDVTIMWTNDNYGHLRQTPNAEERSRSGGSGFYYHVSYFGRPSSVIWNGGTQLGLIKEEMTKAYDTGASSVWILNVGPLKPFENQTEYFLDLGRDINKVRNTSIKDYTAENAKHYWGFDDEQAQEYADIQCKFLETANARRPEFQVQGLYSLTSYGDEGQRILDLYEQLESRSEALYNSLPEEKKPSFYELQLYAIKSAVNVMNNYIGADKSILYKSQRRNASVNKYAKQSTDGYNSIISDTNTYNEMLDGKWNNVINPFQNVEHGSWDIKIGGASADTIDSLGYTKMNIAVENQSDINAVPSLEFSGYTKDVRFIDIFNEGNGNFDWKISSDVNWITFNKNSGTVTNDDRIYAGIDWDNISNGISNANITVTRYIGENAVESKDISVTVNNSVDHLPEKTYAEANGYVSIEAEHFSRSISNGEYEWIEQDDFGRSGNSMKFMPDTEEPLSDRSSYLEYDVNFESTGDFNVDLYRMPTLNERGGVRFAIGIDELSPTELSGCNSYMNNSNGKDKWGLGILNNTEILTANISVTEPGIHKIRLYGIDPGTVIDKLVITTGEKQPSYYGALESFNTTYNNEAMQMPEPSIPSEDLNDVKELFSPKLYTAGLSYSADAQTEGIILDGSPRLVTSVGSGIGIITVYDHSGRLKEMLSSESYNSSCYNFNRPLSISDGDTVKGFVWNNLSEMKCLTETYYPINSNQNTIQGIDIIKLTDIESATLTLAAYDTEGIMLGCKTVNAVFGNSAINEKVNIPINFNVLEGTAELQVIAYDNESCLNALAPSYTLSTNIPSLTASYDSGIINTKSSLDSYNGMEGICLIGNENDNSTVYIRQETIEDNTFKSIPTGELNGIYDIKIGISGIGIAAEEKAYTAKNIQTDNEEYTQTSYSLDFSSQEQAEGLISGNAAYSSTAEAIQMTSTDKSGGKLNISLTEPIRSIQGHKLSVSTKIAYGRQSGKYMDYIIKDSKGNELVKTHFSLYSASSAQLLKIGTDELLTSGLPDGIATKNKNNDGLSNGYSTITSVLDADAGTISVTFSNADGESTYTGKIPSGSSCDISELNYSTTHTYAKRSCYVDDISISRIVSPSYNIEFKPIDTKGNAVDNAKINVTDLKYGTVIEPDTNGYYKLCDGVYGYNITSESYKEISGELELSPATESKILYITME